MQLIAVSNAFGGRYCNGRVLLFREGDLRSVSHTVDSTVDIIVDIAGRFLSQVSEWPPCADDYAVHRRFHPSEDKLRLQVVGTLTCHYLPRAESESKF